MDTRRLERVEELFRRARKLTPQRGVHFAADKTLRIRVYSGSKKEARQNLHILLPMIVDDPEGSVSILKRNQSWWCVEIAQTRIKPFWQNACVSQSGMLSQALGKEGYDYFDDRFEKRMVIFENSFLEAVEHARRLQKRIPSLRSFSLMNCEGTELFRYGSFALITAEKNILAN